MTNGRYAISQAVHCPAHPIEYTTEQTTEGVTIISALVSV